MEVYESIRDVKDLFMHPLHIYPDLAQGVQLPDAAAGNWGAWTQIIPANAIARPFIICGIHTDNLAGGVIGYGRIQLAYGLANTIIGTYYIYSIGFVGIADNPKQPSFIIPANSVVNGRFLTDIAGAITIRAGIYYRVR